MVESCGTGKQKPNIGNQWDVPRWNVLIEYTGIEKILFMVVTDEASHDEMSWSKVAAIANIPTISWLNAAALSNILPISSVTGMVGMFAFAANFNQDIWSWDVSLVTNMFGMFYNASVFNQDISLWNVPSVTKMTSLFDQATAFNQDISSWNVSSVVNMAYMFSNATSFNQNISRWDLSSVTDTSLMFSFANVFNQDFSMWDISSICNTSGMFYRAFAFNQDISLWDVSTVIDMSSMFALASNLSQLCVQGDFRSTRGQISLIWPHSDQYSQRSILPPLPLKDYETLSQCDVGCGLHVYMYLHCLPFLFYSNNQVLHYNPGYDNMMMTVVWKTNLGTVRCSWDPPISHLHHPMAFRVHFQSKSLRLLVFNPNLLALSATSGRTMTQ
jgi:surface protein